MNNLIERIWKQGGMVNIEDLRGTAFQAEESAHTFRIRGVDVSGEPLALTGTVGAVFLRADNTDVAITGTITDGAAEVTLPDECYDMPGRFGLTIYVTSDEQTVAVYAAIGSVCRTSSGVVSPETGEDVMDLINAIDEAIARIPQDYQDLEDDVAALQDDVADLQEDVAELQEETNNYAPVIVKEASGDIVSIDDGAGDMKLKTLEVEIEPVQDTHGLDPYPAGGGKNKCAGTEEGKMDNSTGENVDAVDVYRTINYIPVVPSGNVSISGFIATGNIRVFKYGADKSFKGNSVIELESNKTKTIAIGSETYFIKFQANKSIMTNTTPIQAENGSEVTPFAPYENVCAISGWTSADVKQIGKNLYNKEDTSLYKANTYLEAETGRTLEFVNDVRCVVVPCGSSKTYTISNGIKTTMRVASFTSNPALNTYPTSANAPSGQTNAGVGLTITTGANDTYLVIQVIANTDVTAGTTFENAIATLMVEEGSTVSPYKAYQGETYTYTFPQSAGTVYGAKMPINQDGTGTLIVDHVDVDLTNKTFSASMQGTGRFLLSLPGNSIPSAAGRNADIISTHFKGITESEIDTTSPWVFVANDTTIVVQTGNSSIDTVAKFSTWLADQSTAGTPVKIVYRLASAVPYTMTAQQVVSLLKGKNVLWADCGDVAIEYPVDTKIYIDNLFASITNATGVSF